MGKKLLIAETDSANPVKTEKFLKNTIVCLRCSSL